MSALQAALAGINTLEHSDLLSCPDTILSNKYGSYREFCEAVFDWAAREDLVARSETIISAMLANNVALCPTLGVLHDAAREFGLSSRALTSMRRLVEYAHDRGIEILAGSDGPSREILAGTSLHKELSYLRGCGLSTTNVLKCATSNAGDVLESKCGRIVPGSLADFVVLSDSPFVRLENTSHISEVYVAGKCVFSKGRIYPT